jgi:hypothetical protein
MLCPIAGRCERENSKPAYFIRGGTLSLGVTLREAMNWGWGRGWPHQPQSQDASPTDARPTADVTSSSVTTTSCLPVLTGCIE